MVPTSQLSLPGAWPSYPQGQTLTPPANSPPTLSRCRTPRTREHPVVGKARGPGAGVIVAIVDGKPQTSYHLNHPRQSDLRLQVTLRNRGL